MVTEVLQFVKKKITWVLLFFLHLPKSCDIVSAKWGTIKRKKLKLIGWPDKHEDLIEYLADHPNVVKELQITKGCKY